MNLVVERQSHESSAANSAMTCKTRNSRGSLDWMIGSRPRIRTEKHLGLSQVGIPVPFRRPLTGRPGRSRTDIAGVSDRSSATELQDFRIGTPARTRTLIF